MGCHRSEDSQDCELLVLGDGATVEWKPFKKGDALPDGAVWAGETTTDGRTYVARYQGACGKLNLSNDGYLNNLWVHGQGHFWKGHQESGEILIVKRSVYTHDWVPICRGGEIPSGAVMSGNTSTDGDVYVGRNSKGEAGKVNIEDGKMFNIWCHKQGQSEKCELLVLRNGSHMEWRPWKRGDELPKGAVFAGKTSTDGEHGVYVGRARGTSKYHG